MASLMTKVSSFMRSPQGRAKIDQAKHYAQSPEGRRKIESVRSRLAKRR